MQQVEESTEEIYDALRELFRFSLIDNSHVYSYIEKLPSGMTMEINFEGGWFGPVDNDYYFSVAVNIYKKRKQLRRNRYQATGKDGLSPLIHAKKVIAQFEKFIVLDINRKDENWLPNKTVMLVLWDDNQRKRVYTRGLKSLGYKIIDPGFGPCLGKVLHEK